MSTIVEEAAPKARPAQRFPATVGRFDDPADRAAIDGLVRWVEDRYRADLQERPSKHVYVRTLPATAIAEVDRLRDSPVIRSLIARHVRAGSLCRCGNHRSSDQSQSGFQFCFHLMHSQF